MGSWLDRPPVAQLLDELHERSDRQERRALRPLSVLRQAAGSLGLSIGLDSAAAKAFLSDKLVALDRDKARLCYLLSRAIGARRIVEVGTSFGVSTLYLAAAVREHGGDVPGTVIGTEWEPAKAAAARANLERGGLADLVDLRVGDVRDTLRDSGGPVDFVLIDIWPEVAAPALDLLIPQLRPGAIVLCDNVSRYRRDYRDYLARVRDPEGGFETMTLPYNGGLELSTWRP